jgi:hypothetical protein
MRFTVCMLLFGEHPQLARRLLGSVLRPAWAAHFPDLRIGLNAVCPETADVVQAACRSWPGPFRVYQSTENIDKYPMMRRMLHEQPLEQPFTMWWDDDSFLLPQVDEHWPQRVAAKLVDYEIIGSIWNWTLAPHEIEFLDRQPWVPSKTRKTPRPLPFITGGWWTIWTELLQRHAWPPPDMRHNGGDVSLGHLCWKNYYRLGLFKDSLGINADDTGKDSSSQRRGKSQWPYFHRQAGQPRRK